MDMCLTHIVLSLGRCRHLIGPKTMLLFPKLRQDVIELANCSCRAKTKVDKNLLPHNYTLRLQKRNSKIFIFFQCVLTCLNKFWAILDVKYELCCSGFFLYFFIDDYIQRYIQAGRGASF